MFSTTCRKPSSRKLASPDRMMSRVNCFARPCFSGVAIAVLLRRKAVAFAPDSADALRILRVMLYFHPQIADMHHDGAVGDVEIRLAPHGLVDDLYREKLDEENHGDTILQQFRDHLFEKEEGYAAFLAWMTQESAKIYPYEGRLEIQGKCSVSEIKRQSQIQEPVSYTHLTLPTT